MRVWGAATSSIARSSHRVALCTCARLGGPNPFFLLACLPRRHVDTQVEELKAKVAKLQKARPKNAEASMGPRALAMQVCLCNPEHHAGGRAGDTRKRSGDGSSTR